MSAWSVRRLDWLVTEERRTVDPRTLGVDTVFHYSIPVLDEIGDGRLEPVESIGSGKLLLRGGEVLISKLNPRLPRVLVAEAHDVPTVASTEFIALRPGSDVDDRFLRYWLVSEPVRQMLDGATMSVTRSQQRVRPDVLTKMWARIPTVVQQREIADIIDAKLVAVDLLIEKKRRLAEAFAEEVHTTRFHLVTQAAVQRRRDAGWLGTVPEEWPLVQMNRVARLHLGTTFPHAFQGEREGDLPFVKVGDLRHVDQQGVLQTPENWVSSSVARRLVARILPSDCILFARVGAALLANPRARAPWRCVVDDNVRGLEFTVGLTEYWFHVLRLLDLRALANPGPVPSIGESQVMAVVVPLPDVAIQREVVRHMRQLQETSERVLSALRRQVALLDEHRRALITAAVTGQLDIPGVAA